MKKPKAIDLFAGGGGLTVGLKRAGFSVVAAVELEPHAYATYRANHPRVKAFQQDIRSISGKDILKAIGDGEIDLLAGCPPCQGFTSLTAKYKREDRRNNLVLEMSRLVREIRPRAIMMENVPGLARKGKELYTELKQELEGAGYIVADGILEVADFGVPQLRKRLVLVGGLGFEIDLPQTTHSRDGKDGLQKWRTVRQAISGKLGKAKTLDKAREEGPIEESDWHIVRSLSDKNIERLKAAKPGRSWSRIPEDLRPTCHQGGYNGFTNVYGRMSWGEPSPTITGGCTTLSKGRFGHPQAKRTISVREAALLQTFPIDYRFDTPYMEYVCNIIGNALPCDFATAVSKQCIRELRAQDRATG